MDIHSDGDQSRRNHLVRLGSVALLAFWRLSPLSEWPRQADSVVIPRIPGCQPTNRTTSHQTRSLDRSPYGMVPGILRTDVPATGWLMRTTSLSCGRTLHALLRNSNTLTSECKAKSKISPSDSWCRSGGSGLTLLLLCSPLRNLIPNLDLLSLICLPKNAGFIGPLRTLHCWFFLERSFCRMRSMATCENEAKTRVLEGLMAEGDFYRGGTNLRPRPFEVRIDPTSGLVLPTHGISVFSRPDNLEQLVALTGSRTSPRSWSS